MKLRIVVLDVEEAPWGKNYLMVAYQMVGNRIVTRPGILQVLNDKGLWETVEIQYGMESFSLGDVRELPAEVQVPVYRKSSGEGGEEPSSPEGSGNSQGSGVDPEKGSTH